MNKLFRILSILICVAMVLSACSPAANEAPSPGGEKITINIWGFEGEMDFFPKLIEAFEAENPNIEIKLTEIPESDYVTKMDTAMLAGEGPDVAFVYVPRWLKAGKFLALEDTIKQYNIPVDDFNKGALAQNCVFEGKIYCVGTYTGAIIMVYNKDIFDQKGVPYPSATEPMSVEEYAQMALKLTTKSDKIEERVWGGDGGVPIWWMARSNFVGVDGKTMSFSDEPTTRAIELFAQMRVDGSAMTEADSAVVAGEAQDLFVQGKLATTILDNLRVISAAEAANMNFGVAIVPTERKGDTPWVVTWSDSYGVLSSSKHPGEALKFVAFIGTKGNELRLELGSLPLNMKMAEQWAVTEPRRQALAVIKLAQPEVFCPGFWEATEGIWDGWTSIIVDGRPVKEVIAEIEPDMQEALDRAWQTFEEIK